VVKGICIFEHEPKELIFLLKKIKFTNLRTERYTSSNNLYNIHIKKKTSEVVVPIRMSFVFGWVSGFLERKRSMMRRKTTLEIWERKRQRFMCGCLVGSKQKNKSLDRFSRAVNSLNFVLVLETTFPSKPLNQFARLNTLTYGNPLNVSDKKKKASFSEVNSFSKRERPRPSKMSGSAFADRLFSRSRARS